MGLQIYNGWNHMYMHIQCTYTLIFLHVHVHYNYLCILSPDPQLYVLCTYTWSHIYILCVNMQSTTTASHMTITWFNALDINNIESAVLFIMKSSMMHSLHTKSILMTIFEEIAKYNFHQTLNSVSKYIHSILWSLPR